MVNGTLMRYAGPGEEGVENHEGGAYCLFEYQDLAQFLPESMRARERITGDPQHARKRQPREIDSYQVWCEAWYHYKAFLLFRLPHLATSLTRYETFIGNAADTYSWKAVYGYDVAFRTRMGQAQGAMRWSEPDPLLMERYLTGPMDRIGRTGMEQEEEPGSEHRLERWALGKHVVVPMLRVVARRNPYLYALGVAR